MPFISQASEGLWNGWIITESLVIAIHLILIITDLFPIIDAYREAVTYKDDFDIRPAFEMNYFGGDAWPGIVHCTVHFILIV